MRKFNRRTLMATGAAITAGGLLGSPAAAQEGQEGEDGESEGGEPEQPESGTDADFPRPDGVAWSYDGAYDVQTMTVDGGRLYTQSDGAVYAIDTADGSLVWETGDISAGQTPVVEGETVYTAGAPGEGGPVRAIDAETGEIRWESEIESYAMAVGHGMVYASTEGTAYALDAEDGSIVWERDEVTFEQENPGENEEATIEFLAVGDVDDDRVYVYDDDSWGRDIIGLDPATGEIDVVVGFIDGVSSVYADSGYLGVQPPFDSTYLIDIAANEIIGGISQSVGQHFSGGGYFTANLRGRLLAYDLSAGGEQVWETEFSRSYPEVLGETAVMLYGPRQVMHDLEEGEDEDRIMAYDLQTGEEQWRYVFDERNWEGGLILSIAIDENTVYVERNDELLALRSEVEEGGSDEPEEDEPEKEDPEESEDDEPTDDESEDPGDDTDDDSDDSDDSDDDTDEPGDDADDSEDDAGDDEPATDDPSTDLGLSVRVPGSISRGESACFDVTVRNHGSAPIETTITLAVGDVIESVTVEIAPGDCYASFHRVACSDLSGGANEWTLTAGGETETGTLTLE